MDDPFDSSAWASSSPTASPKIEFGKPDWSALASSRGIDEDDGHGPQTSKAEARSTGSDGQPEGVEDVEIAPLGNEEKSAEGDGETDNVTVKNLNISANQPEDDLAESSKPTQRITLEDETAEVSSPVHSGPGLPAQGTNYEDDDFDDFADFDDSPAVAQTLPATSHDEGFDEDAFEDFADQSEFENGQNGSMTSSVAREADNTWRSSPLKSLNLRPLPNPSDLLESITDVLGDPLNGRPTVDENLGINLVTQEPVRQIEGLAQILTTERSRETFTQLVELPQLKPIDWTRSRVRREHLISLGIPVNLDEVELPRTSALPPLKIVTRHQTSSSDARRSITQSPVSSATAGPGPSTARHLAENALGERPAFNADKAKRLLDYREDQLSLVPPKYLSRMQDDLVEVCAQASALSAHLKQVKEIRAEENRKKNEQIAELISKAQRLKATEMQASSGGLFRKGSVKRNSGSGGSTPRRVASPGIYTR